VDFAHVINPNYTNVKALGWKQVSCGEGSKVSSRGVSERERWTEVQVQILSSGQSLSIRGALR
jgi:hypothetical protein